MRPDRIVNVRIKPGVRQSLADARENFEASLRVGAGTRPAILIDVREGEPLTAEARHYLSGKRLTDGFSALVLLVGGWLLRSRLP